MYLFFSSRRLLSRVGTGALFFFLISQLQVIAPAPAAAFSVGEERELGEKLLHIIRKELAVVDEPDITDYLNGIGREIIAQAGSQYFDYHFFVIKAKGLNAFAAPSGLICVNSGLFEAVDSEDELVAVLAHEIGHVRSRHIADRMAKGSKVGIGTMAAVLAGMLLGGGVGGALSEALITGSMAAGASLNLKFSRTDEEEADRLSFQWLKAMNRDPKSMLEVARKIRKLQVMSSGKVPAYLLTHPEPEARMGYIQDLLAINGEASYPQLDEFGFRRIKSRIMSLTREPADLISHHRREIANAEANSFGKAMANYGLSQAYSVSGSYEQALAALEETRQMQPGRPILDADLGALYLQAGRHDEAITVLSRIRDAELSYGTFLLARAYQQIGDLDRAVSLYESLEDNLPDNVQLYYNLGNLYSQQKKQGIAYYYLGVYSWLSGDLQNAKFSLRRAVRELPAGNAIREKAVAKLKVVEDLDKDRGEL